MFIRTLESKIEAYLKSQDHKIFFIWGPRRSGKTTLLKKLSKGFNTPIFNFDVISDREKFLPDRELLSQLISEHKLILIDEIQNYPQATVILKILYDEFEVKVIATGSSELRQKTGEDFDSLAGRFTENFCLPLSVLEIADNLKVKLYQQKDFITKLQKDIQIFGSYPEIYTKAGLLEVRKIEVLQNILDTYILKDIINIYDLKNEKLAKDILTKIALQLGSEVSTREIANSLQANVSTVANYIEIFIKNYILIPLSSFKTNRRKAVSENRKLYFYDLGVRNILVRDFRDLNLRPDAGSVFENFVISEIEKKKKNSHAKFSMYFYREYGGKEIDLVLEDYKKNYVCVEIKRNKKPNRRNIFPLKHSFKSLDSSNYFDVFNRLF